MNTGASEVARMRQLIAAELEAIQRVATGLAVGVARHEFIQARMTQLGRHQEQLAGMIGKSDAAQTVCELYVNIVVGEHKT